MPNKQLVTERHLSNRQSQTTYHIIGTMAPIGLVNSLSMFSSPEVGIISLVAFLILSITLLALCINHNRPSSSSSKAHNGKGSTTEGLAASRTNGTTKTEAFSDTETDATSSYRGHSNMPPNTLPKSKTYSQ